MYMCTTLYSCGIADQRKIFFIFSVDNSMQHSDDEDSISEDEETIDKVRVNVNFLTLKSDQHLISFYSSTPESCTEVRRMKELITN